MAPGENEIGHRLSIRLRVAEGGFRDIVGILESETSIRKRDGSLALFDPDDVAVWRKVVAPKDRAGHGAPLSLRIRDMEAAANATWPAKENERLGDWIMRASGKFTMRANSVLPLGDPPYGNPGIDIHEAISHVIAFYARHDLPAIFHIPLPTYFPLDELLDEQGWFAKITALVMVKDIGEATLPDESMGTWEFHSAPTTEWLDVQGDHNVAEIMTSAPATYAGLRVKGVLVAVGRGAGHEKWWVLSRLFVQENFRRKGVARNLVSALLAEGQTHGATKSLLQVDENNESATHLYRSMGFVHHHSYTYRVRNLD